MSGKGDSIVELIDKLKAFAEEVYADLGSGHSENIYEEALLVCLRIDAIKYEHQKVVEVLFREHYVGEGYADIVVKCSGNNCIVVEVKALAGKLAQPEEAQVRKYMSKLNAARGLLINFQQPARDKQGKKKHELEIKVVS
jgi:GxxExxY protein